MLKFWIHLGLAAIIAINEEGLTVANNDKIERLSITDGIHVEHIGQAYMASEAATDTIVSIIINMPNLVTKYMLPLKGYLDCRNPELGPSTQDLG